MANQQRICPLRMTIAAFALMLWTGGLVAASFGQEKDDLRDLKPSVWYKSRAKSAGQPTSNQPVLYKRKTPPVKPTAPTDDAEVGVTVWRLRPAKADDAFEIRDLIRRTASDGSAEQQAWTPERIEADTALYEGQLVRLTVESLRAGYLYVFNRSRYADGTYGDPYLIFPNRGIYGGNNKVRAGEPVQIPGPNEEPFELRRGSSRQSQLQESEELILLVTPQPHPSIPIPADRLKVTQQSLERLIEKYRVPVSRFEQQSGAGKTITVEEKKAARREGFNLKSEDPYPQTVFRIASKAGEPMLVILNLKVSEKKS